MIARANVRNVVLAILGAAILILKPLYNGPADALVLSYAGNVAVSFTLYFAAHSAAYRYGHPRLVAAATTFVAVEMFELTNGFGLMENVFDPADLLANAAGIALALLVDIASARLTPASAKAD